MAQIVIKAVAITTLGTAVVVKNPMVALDTTAKKTQTATKPLALTLILEVGPRLIAMGMEAIVEVAKPMAVVAVKIMQVKMEVAKMEVVALMRTEEIQVG